MQLNQKYLVAMTLLAVLAVVFGVAGSTATMSKPVSPRSSSPSDGVAHFQNPPTFDSGWMDIIDKAGQSFSITHDLNTTDALVDVVGRQSLTSVNHKLFFGSTVYLPPSVNRTYGGAAFDQANSLVRTSDGGYAMAGVTVSFGAGGQDFWLVKVNSDLDVEWNQTYGGAFADHSWSLVQTSDGGYALAGTTLSFSGGLDWDFWLVKTGSFGNMVWNRSIGGLRDDVAHVVVETNDGGFALAGYTNSFGAGRGDFWLVKTDSNGNHLWNRTYGGTGDDVARSVVQTTDGGFALAGYTNSSGAGSDDFWLVKTDSLGFKLWSRTYGGGANEYAYSLVQTFDGGYAIGGSTDSIGAGSDDFWLVKTDSLGFIQWSQTYGGTSAERVWSLIQTSDGGYALAGFRSTYSGDIWLVKTDSTGSMLWSQVYGTIVADHAYSLVETSDGGYAMAGDTEVFWGAGNYDFWLVKTGVGELGSSLGLSMTGFANSTITFYRGSDDPFWNYMRVRIWLIEEPTWQFGDINQDGVVDAQDLYILSRNYGTTFSILSLTGIFAVAGIHQYKKRRHPA